MAKVERLSSSTAQQIQSAVIISSYLRCIEELVYNALNANSTCIAVRAGLSFGSIQVVDNGTGISKADMRLVGERYVTGAAKHDERVEGALSAGHRGETLASIRDLCKSLQIISRCSAEQDGVLEETYDKTFKGDICSAVCQSLIQRPCSGTTVMVERLFSNLPVRQKHLQIPRQLEKILYWLKNLSMMHPHVSFSFRNEDTGKVLFQARKSETISGAFANAFGSEYTSHLREVHYTDEYLSIRGCVAVVLHIDTRLQFVYVNNRPMQDPRLSELLNQLLTKPLMLRHLDENESSSSADKSHTNLTKFEKNPIFALKISCPQDDCAVIMDNNKAQVSFKNAPSVLNSIKKAVLSFLREMNIAANLSHSELAAAQAMKVSSGEVASEITTSDITNSVFSKTVLRPAGNLWEAASYVGTLPAVPVELKMTSQPTSHTVTQEACCTDGTPPQHGRRADQKASSIPYRTETVDNISPGRSSGSSSQCADVLAEIVSHALANHSNLTYKQTETAEHRYPLCKNDESERYRCDQSAAASAPNTPVTTPRPCTKILSCCCFARSNPRNHCRCREMTLAKANSWEHFAAPRPAGSSSSSRASVAKILARVDRQMQLARDTGVSEERLGCCQLLPEGGAAVARSAASTMQSPAIQDRQKHVTAARLKRHKDAHSSSPTAAQADCQQLAALDLGSSVPKQRKLPLDYKVHKHVATPTALADVTNLALKQAYEGTAHRGSNAPLGVLQNPLLSSLGTAVANNSLNLSAMAENNGGSQKMSSFISYGFDADDPGGDQWQIEKPTLNRKTCAASEGMSWCITVCTDSDWLTRITEGSSPMLHGDRHEVCGKYHHTVCAHSADFYGDDESRTARRHEGGRTEENQTSAHERLPESASTLISQGAAHGELATAGGEPRTDGDVEHERCSWAAGASCTDIPGSQGRCSAFAGMTRNCNYSRAVSGGCDHEQSSLPSLANAAAADSGILPFGEELPDSTQHTEVCPRGTENCEKDGSAVGPSHSLNSHWRSVLFDSLSDDFFRSDDSSFDLGEVAALGERPLDCEPNPTISRDLSESGCARENRSNSVMDPVPGRTSRKSWCNLSKNAIPFFTMNVKPRRASKANAAALFNELLEEPASPESRKILVTKNQALPSAAGQLLQLDSESMTRCSFIGQFDGKFILLRMELPDATTLLAIDQHAAHERIRLEDLTRNALLSQEPDANGTSFTFRSLRMPFPVHVQLDGSTFQVLQISWDCLKRLGIKGVALLPGWAIISEFPSCFLPGELSSSKARKGCDSLVKEVLLDVLNEIVQAGGVVPTMPKAYQRVLSSRACRGAIKFGDQLDCEQCTALVELLSQCRLPFQCAHGRPSAVPLWCIAATPPSSSEEHAVEVQGSLSKRLKTKLDRHLAT